LEDYSGRIDLLLFGKGRRIGKQFFHFSTCLCDKIIVRSIPQRLLKGFEMESFIGTIMPVAFNFAPQGWALCNGQLLSISQNSALFALLGTYYGGDGQTTFGLPDLRGRVAVGQGQGPNAAAVQMGELSGSNATTMTLNGAGTVTLTTANMPAHKHGASFSGTGATPLAVTVNVNSASGTSLAPAEGSYLGAVKMSGPGPTASLYVAGQPTTSVALGSGTVTATGTAGGITGGTVEVDNNGSGQPVSMPVSVSGQTSLMQPFTGVNYIICVNGIFPSRQ
jgi:microcystin-dependent protein